MCCEYWSKYISCGDRPGLGNTNSDHNCSSGNPYSTTNCSDSTANDFPPVHQPIWVYIIHRII